MMVFAACYLFSTMVLVADVDLRCQRVFPLNYCIWLAQAASLAYIICYCAIKLDTFLVLSMMVIMLAVSVIYAISGHMDISFQVPPDNVKSRGCKSGQILYFCMTFAGAIFIAFVLCMIYKEYDGTFAEMMPLRFNRKR